MTITEIPRSVQHIDPPPVVDPGFVPGRRRERRLAEAAPQARRSRPPREPFSPWRAVALSILLSISLLTLWLLLYVVVFTQFQESHQQSLLYNNIRQQLALETAPLGGQIVPGVAVALMSAPSLGIEDVVVVEGTASRDLMAGPGHRRDTVLPGQAGTSQIYGRGSLFGGPFGGMSRATLGGTITVTTGQGIFHYRVVDIRHAGDPAPQPLAAGGGRLTLVTADGLGALGALRPSGTVYLDATLVEPGQPTPSGRVASVPDAENLMQSDVNALIPLALALPLLIGSVFFVVWAPMNWGVWQTWLVGMPLVLGSLWMVSQYAVQLLPNLL